VRGQAALLPPDAKDHLPGRQRNARENFFVSPTRDSDRDRHFDGMASKLPTSVEFQRRWATQLSAQADRQHKRGQEPKAQGSRHRASTTWA
jgi:hypothetical protein